MLPDLANIDVKNLRLSSSYSQNRTTYPIIKKIYEDLVISQQLDFEYMPAIGDLNLANKLFDVMFGSSVTCKSQIAMSQTCGLQSGYFIVAHIVKHFYENSNLVYVRNTNTALSELFKGYQFELRCCDIGNISVIPEGSVIVIENPSADDVVILMKKIEIINNKRLMLILSINELEKIPNTPFDKQLSNTTKRLSELIVNIDTIAINVDLTKVLRVGGANLGHLYIKVDSNENAKNCEGAISFLNRNTFSTPVKMNCFILNILLENPEYLKTLGNELLLD